MGLTDAQIEQMRVLQEIQERQMQVIQGALPSISSILSSFRAELEEMRQNCYDDVIKQKGELESRVEYVLALIDNLR